MAHAYLHLYLLSRLSSHSLPTAAGANGALVLARGCVATRLERALRAWASKASHLPHQGARLLGRWRRRLAEALLDVGSELCQLLACRRETCCNERVDCGVVRER